MALTAFKPCLKYTDQEGIRPKWHNKTACFNKCHQQRLVQTQLFTNWFELQLFGSQLQIFWNCLHFYQNLINLIYLNTSLPKSAPAPAPRRLLCLLDGALPSLFVEILWDQPPKYLKLRWLGARTHYFNRYKFEL